MGCKNSKENSKGSQPQKSLLAPQNQGVKAAPKKKLDPKDYIISGKQGETIVKEIGSIDGQQFNIEECKGCDIFLVDHIATTFIDECEDCRIFVGPVESSVFLRNCKSCSLVIACQQFRSRDCENCRLALFCTTEPIIETSVNMRFACFDFFYFSLREQIQRARLSLWNNKWWQVHDFNKNPEKPNWDLLPQEEVRSLLRADKCSCIAQEELYHDFVVPLTLGSRPRPHQDACFIIVLPGSEACIEPLLAKVGNSNWALCRTRSMVLDEQQLKTLFAWSKEKNLMKQCKGQELAGIEICGQSCIAQAESWLSSAEFSSVKNGIRVVPEEHTKPLAQAFFESWKDAI